jgi:protein subunit release factor A
LGQHINKVSTQVTIRHVPTGVSVTASDSPSQSTNRQLALERLLDLFEKAAGPSSGVPEIIDFSACYRLYYV